MGVCGAPEGIQINPRSSNGGSQCEWSKAFSWARRRVSSRWLGLAADLPVKAKPVEYVKVLSLYGASFWYVPRLDTCEDHRSFVSDVWNTDSGNPRSVLALATGRPRGSDRHVELRLPRPQQRERRSAHADRVQHSAVVHGSAPVGDRCVEHAGNNSANATSLVSGALNGGADTLWVDRGFISSPASAGRIGVLRHQLVRAVRLLEHSSQVTPARSASTASPHGAVRQRRDGDHLVQGQRPGSGGRVTNLGFQRVAAAGAVAATGEWSLGNTSFDNRASRLRT